jgi:hypothetical protein
MKVINDQSHPNPPQNFYTGVGARKTPPHVLDLMTKLAEKLSLLYILRSGGAKGADQAFEKGAKFANIYYANDATVEAINIAGQYHPAWNKCQEWARKLHGRNAFQILGNDLAAPSKFVLCWTPDGAISHAERTIKTGGTGTAISIASAYGVPVYNLQRYDHFMLALEWVNK